MAFRLIVLLILWFHASQQQPFITSSTLSCQPCLCFHNTDYELVANCSSRNISAVPSSVPSDVTILLMRENNIDLLKPKVFFRLPQLKILDLSDNVISNIHVYAFNNMTNLQELRLQNNRMTSYPDMALSALKSLTSLHMDGLQNSSFGEGFHSLKQLTILDVSGGRGVNRPCHITSLLNNTFINLSQVKMLNLSNCNISSIELAAFSPMTSLHTLDLSYNRHLGFSMLGRGMYGLQFSSLKVLVVNAIVQQLAMCVIIKKDDFRYLQNTFLEKIYIDQNRIEAFEKHSLNIFPSTLKYVSARDNRFTYSSYIYDLTNMTGITTLIIEFNQSPVGVGPGSIEHSLQTRDQMWNPCSDCFLTIMETYPKEVSWEDDVTADHVPSNMLLYVYTVPVPPYLQTLRITKSHFAFVLSNLRFSKNNISLLDLSYNLLQTWGGPVYGLENVTHLDLSHNLAWNISERFFEHFDKLQSLNMSYNLFSTMFKYNPFNHFLQPLKSLRLLYLSHNGIDRFSEHTFTGLHSLETLILTNNVLHLDLPLRLNTSKHLTLVNFSNNQIQWFSNVLMDDFDKLSESHNITLDLSHNPLACTCAKLYFVEWIINSRINFYNKKNYYCILENGTYSRIGNWEDNFEELRSQCQLLNLGSLVSIFFCTLTLIVLIISAIIYRFRWKMRYWYYAARLKYKNLVLSNNGPFDFVAFVSYSVKDDEFVDEILDRVETSAGLKLFVHQRDFVGGGMIAENILSAIQKSRKTLVVLSRNFLSSQWCMYELQMAIMEAASTGRDIVVLIMLEFIPYNDLPDVVRSLVVIDSYIDYEQFEQKDIFWERVISALNKP